MWNPGSNTGAPLALRHNQRQLEHDKHAEPGQVKPCSPLYAIQSILRGAECAAVSPSREFQRIADNAPEPVPSETVQSVQP